jgi:hypothetical protein
MGTSPLQRHARLIWVKEERLQALKLCAHLIPVAAEAAPTGSDFSPMQIPG